MRDVVARIADAVVELNATAQKVSDNDTVEFDVDQRLSVLEVAVDDLQNDVEETVELVGDTST